MSGTDYTKKGQNGNSGEGHGRGEGGRSGPGSRPSLRIRLTLWIYELKYLYKSRAERLLLGVILVLLAASCLGLAYLSAVFQRPAAIEYCPKSQG